MIDNLQDYFLPEYEYFLNSIEYVRVDAKNMYYNLTNTETVMTSINEDGNLTVIFERDLKFEPEGVFRLKASFGAILKFNPEKYSEYNWKELKLADEFKYNGGFVLGNLSSRLSLLISNITASFGQPPILLPPYNGQQSTN